MPRSSIKRAIRHASGRGATWAPIKERVHQGSGVDGVSMAMVPMIQNPRNRRRPRFREVRRQGMGQSPRQEQVYRRLHRSIVNSFNRASPPKSSSAIRSQHDELTALPNRRALLEELARPPDAR